MRLKTGEIVRSFHGCLLKMRGSGRSHHSMDSFSSDCIFSYALFQPVSQLSFSRERNHRGHGRFDVLFEGDLHILGFELLDEKAGKQQQTYRTLWNRWDRSDRVGGCQQSDMPACRASAGYNAFWINAQFGCVLFISPNCGISDTLPQECRRPRARDSRSNGTDSGMRSGLLCSNHRRGT